jgi:hypothetical protein
VFAPTKQTRRALVTAPVALALLAGGCGGDSSTPTVSAAPSAEQFPATDGKTLAELSTGSSASDLVVAPSEQVFSPGDNRFGFGVFTVKHGNVPDAQVAIYVARPNGKALGPFPASVASLATKPAFQSQTTVSDPDAAAYVYTSQVKLPGEGKWDLMAMFRDDDGNYTVASAGKAVVDNPIFKDIPNVGDKAPIIHTPTADDVGGDLSKIDTRVPPDTMHDVDFADVVGKQPIVLLFATPALCQSRVCGPVVDIAEEVKNERPDDAAFIHMEVYKNNTPPNINEQLTAYGLMTEPWLFVIGTDGRVSTRIEGAFSAAELNAALDKVS